MPDEKRGHHHTEPVVIVAIVWMPVVAVSAADVVLGIVERAPANHAAVLQASPLCR
jgi:hypothetical protein